MIRNLKVLIAAAIAAAALSAIGASAAQAAEFHCSVEPCTYRAKQDGTEKTGHFVFIIETANTSTSVSFTCEEFSGSGTTAKKTSSTLTLGSIKYNSGKCLINASLGVEWKMNGCKYEFSAAGTFKVVGCEAGKKIEVNSPGPCTFTIGEQGLLTGVTYHNIGTTPTREVTVSLNVHGIVVEAHGTCFGLPTTTPLEGTFTTGNFILRGENAAGVMADGWWE